MARSRRVTGRRGAAPGRHRSGSASGPKRLVNLSFLSGMAVGGVVVYCFLVYRPGITIPERWAPTAEVDGTASPLPAPEAPAEPDFTFFEILPDREVRVYDWELKQDPPPATDAPTASPAAPVDYVVQAGSFKQMAEADQMKAELALNGIRSSIQRVVINGQDVWFRVHLGPFNDRESLADARAKLNRLGVKHIVLKQGPASG